MICRMNCFCLNAAVVKTKTTLGEDHGRQFFGCGNPNGCNFFMWVDASRPHGPSSNAFNQRDFQVSMNVLKGEGGNARLPAYGSSSSSFGGVAGVGGGGISTSTRKLSVRLSISTFQGSPPEAWFASVHAYDPILERYYKS